MPVSKGPTNIQLPNGKPYTLKSCMKSRCTEESKVQYRVDAKGNEIKQGNQKAYKLTFVDQVNKTQPLLQVTMVESYKKYNTD